MASMTRASPSSYPTLSTHVGSETEIACSVKAGIVLPRGISEGAMVVGVDVERKSKSSYGM